MIQEWVKNLKVGDFVLLKTHCGYTRQYTVQKCTVASIGKTFFMIGYGNNTPHIKIMKQSCREPKNKNASPYAADKYVAAKWETGIESIFHKITLDIPFSIEQLQQKIYAIERQMTALKVESHELTEKLIHWDSGKASTP